MTFRFFEGPAGTGKTHNIIECARALCNEGVLHDGSRILALTFMNGARRRLQHRMGQQREFRRRYESLTFDAFARSLVARRQSGVRSAGLDSLADGLNEFDGPCCIAGALLENPVVVNWVSASFPLVIVDEAQDLDNYRLSILSGLAASCNIIVGADAFQCLADGRDTSELMAWLMGSGETTHLTEPMRTAEAGLLAVADALRNGRDVLTELTQSTQTKNPTWNGSGITIVESPGNNAGIVAWNIANQIRRCGQGRTVILTPDAQTPRILEALELVRTRGWANNLGPFPFVWERKEAQVTQDILEEICLPQQGGLAELRAVFAEHMDNAVIAAALSRLQWRRRALGQTEWSREEIAGLIEEAVRNQYRHTERLEMRSAAMTIHGAKNREFPNVVVLWPQTVAGTSEHKRRLLYNAITRAKRHCSVVVIGQGRCANSPFAPER